MFSGDTGKKAAGAAVTGLNNAYSGLSGQYSAGRDALSSAYGNDSTGALQSFYDLGLTGSSAYADATGANGQAGYDRAKKSFESSPGYQSGLDRSLDANDRRAASRGTLGSGNTIADSDKLTVDYANDKYNDYVKNLSGWLTPTESSAASLGTDQTSKDIWYGGAQNTSYQKQGDADYNTQAGVGKAQADGITSDYTASKNLWNGLLGLTNTASKSSGASSLFSSFGTTPAETTDNGGFKTSGWFSALAGT